MVGDGFITINLKRFIMLRLNSMLNYPGLWGSTKESFGLQLVFLLDLHNYSQGDSTPTVRMMQLVFGPGPQIETDVLTQEWAREKTQKVIDHLGIKFPPEFEKIP